ncbi:MAG TPA: HAD-IA family hydrolase [Gaiellaceae bacterium]|nr:HAD-IA family hydrolase [Gaiellaceae bacterium]
MRFPVVLFDLDGTLIDSGPMIVSSMRHAAKTVLGREIPDEVLAAAVGGPGLVAQMQALAPDRVDDLVAAYREHNEPLHERLEAFWEVVEVLPRLREEGRRLGVVTAKRHATVRLAFDRLPELESNFDVVIASDDTERHKPSPDPILAALDRLGADPADAAYVGDSPFDVRAAKAAGVHAIAVAWGGIHPDEVLEREGPDSFVRHAEELLAVL